MDTPVPAACHRRPATIAGSENPPVLADARPGPTTPAASLASRVAVHDGWGAAAGPDEPATRVRGTLELIGLVVAPTTMITALLYYFGWVRTGAFFGYFGVDQSTLQLSATDYLLRSAGVAFRPLAALLLVLGAWSWLHLTLQRAGVPGKHARAIRRARAALPWCAAALIGPPVVSLLAAPLPFLPPLAAAALLGAGALLADLELRLRSQRRTLADGTPGHTNGPRWAAHLVLASTVFLALFWSTAVYANASGHALAVGIAAQPATRPGVTLYCRQRPAISGHGVTTTVLTDKDNQYRYRYDGLVLLLHDNTTWLLLPIAWARDDPVIRLPDDPSCRLDFHPSP